MVDKLCCCGFSEQKTPFIKLVIVESVWWTFIDTICGLRVIVMIVRKI